MSEQVSIVVIDDHPIFRAGVVEVLSAEPGFVVVGQGSTAEDAVQIADAASPAVLLLDVAMPGGGIEAARTISTRRPDARIIMLTVVAEDSFVLSALGAGARGYVLKGINGAELIRTIRSLLQCSTDECLINPGIAARILARDNGSIEEASPLLKGTLSEVDRRIMSLMACGKQDEHIAVQLGLDEELVRERVAFVSQFIQMGKSASAAPALPDGRRLH